MSNVQYVEELHKNFLHYLQHIIREEVVIQESYYRLIDYKEKFLDFPLILFPYYLVCVRIVCCLSLCLCSLNFLGLHYVRLMQKAKWTIAIELREKMMV